MRLKLAIILAKFVKFSLKIAHHRGGSLPGKLAMKICKDPLGQLKYPKIVILTTGTNGKTTTNNMIYQVMKSKYHTISNFDGDNLVAGITTLILTNTKLNLEVNAEAICIEIDELTLPKIIDKLPVSHVVINNLFRDQLDRVGEMENVIRKFLAAFENYKGKLILNGNDPNVARIGYHKDNVLYFGVDYVDQGVKYQEAKEGQYCFNCKTKLEYEYHQYSHIGKFRCPNCDFTSYDIINATKISPDFKHFIVNDFEFDNPYNTIYSIYNCMALIVLLNDIGINNSDINKVFKSFKLNEGRMEEFNLGRKCLFNLIKNPTGANEIIKFIIQDQNPKDILFILNDNGQDGRDVSWIYDVNFDLLINSNVKNIVCSGTRAYDAALVFKYNGYENNLKVFTDDEEAIKYYKDLENNGYILVTYTAMRKARSIIKRYL